MYAENHLTLTASVSSWAAVRARFASVRGLCVRGMGENSERGDRVFNRLEIVAVGGRVGRIRQRGGF